MSKSTVISHIRCDCGSSLRVRGDSSATLDDIGRFFKRHFRCINVNRNDTPHIQINQSGSRSIEPIEIVRSQAGRKEIRLQCSAMMCEHANEVPAQCPCEEECYCKTHTCAPRKNSLVRCRQCNSVFDAKTTIHECSGYSKQNLVVTQCTREYGHSGPCNGWPCDYVRKKIDFAQLYGMSGKKFAEVTSQEEVEKLNKQLGWSKTPPEKSKHYSRKEILTFKPLRDAVKRFFDTDGPYV